MTAADKTNNEVEMKGASFAEVSSMAGYPELTAFVGKQGRGTGQIRGRVKEDQNGIGNADARSLSSIRSEGVG